MNVPCLLPNRMVNVTGLSLDDYNLDEILVPIKIDSRLDQRVLHKLRKALRLPGAAWLFFCMQTDRLSLTHL